MLCKDCGAVLDKVEEKAECVCSDCELLRMEFLNDMADALDIVTPDTVEEMAEHYKTIDEINKQNSGKS